VVVNANILVIIEIESPLLIRCVSPEVITEPQVKRFWAIAKTNNVTDDEIGKILDKFSVTSAKDIPMGKYDLIIKELEAVVSF
jgi:hypothetical protein